MPGGHKNIKGTDGNTFSSTNQPDNRGRKPKLFSQLSAEWRGAGIEQATPERVKESFEFLLALTLSEIREISGDPKDDKNNMPMIIRLAAKELIGRNAQGILKEMLDRAHGKSKQGGDYNMNISGETAFSSLPIEKRLAIWKILNDGDEPTIISDGSE